MIISIIIPVYNEAENILRLQPFFKMALQNNNVEIIIVDGGSTDNSIEIAKRQAIKVLNATIKGRATQMNLGAENAKGDIFYFMHADVLPHADFYNQIINATNSDIDFGCYKYNFDSDSTILKFNAYMTQFNGSWAGGGDQTLFIKRTVFKTLNGFNPNCIIMEDFDLIKRAKKSKLNFAILPYNITVSARKYINNSWFRVQMANAIVLLGWKFGAPQHWLKEKYQKWLH